MAPPAEGDPITYSWITRAIHGRVGRFHRAHELLFFMAEPLWKIAPGGKNEVEIPTSQCVDYEGITWERGWTDGVALRAAHALASSR